MNLEQIDTSTTAGKIRVMELAEQGRQVATTNAEGSWRSTTTPEWAWDSYDYAIIAEPVGPEEVYLSIKGEAIIMAVVREEDAQKRFAGLPVVRYIRADLAGEGT